MLAEREREREERRGRRWCTVLGSVSAPSKQICILYVMEKKLTATDRPTDRPTDRAYSVFDFDFENIVAPRRSCDKVKGPTD